MSQQRLLAATHRDGGAAGGTMSPAGSVGPGNRTRRAFPWAIRSAGVLGRYGALIALAGIVVGFSLASPYFLNPSNLLQLVNQASLPIIMSIGLTFVLATGEFDLSIGQLASFSGMLFTLLLTHGHSIGVAIVLCLAAGVAAGLVNGFLVVKLEINALIATLGTGTCFVGSTYLLNNGSPITIFDQSFISISIGDWYGIPRDVVYMVGVGILAWIVLNETVLGRHVQAVGGNTDAARLAGIRVGSVKFACFVVSGLLAALVGVLLASQLGSGQPTAANEMTLGAFAACFLGSTVLSEGRFHVIGTAIGALVVAAGFNGLSLVGLPSYVQQYFQGGLLIIAVALSTLGRRVSRDEAGSRTSDNPPEQVATPVEGVRS